MSVIYLAGGCFWGVQKYFDQFEGIIKTTVGYANGRTENPKYEDIVLSGDKLNEVKVLGKAIAFQSDII